MRRSVRPRTIRPGRPNRSNYSTGFRGGFRR